MSTVLNSRVAELTERLAALEAKYDELARLLADMQSEPSLVMHLAQCKAARANAERANAEAAREREERARREAEAEAAKTDEDRAREAAEHERATRELADRIALASNPTFNAARRAEAQAFHDAREAEYRRVARLPVDERNARLSAMERWERIALLAVADDALGVVLAYPDPGELIDDMPAHLRHIAEARTVQLPARARVGALPPGVLDIAVIDYRRSERLRDAGLGHLVASNTAQAPGEIVYQRPREGVYGLGAIQVMLEVDPELRALADAGRFECRPMSDDENVAWQIAQWVHMPHDAYRNSLPRKARGQTQQQQE